MNVKLNQIASFSKGKQINGEELLETGIYDYLNGGINPSGKWNEFNAEGNTIAISEGGNSCGYVNYMDFPFWCGAHCYYLYDIKCDVKYLYYALKSQQDRLMRIRTGACMPNIKKNDLGNFEFRFDDNVTLQKCIVYELDFVESLITARREQLAKLDELIKSRFIELFGDCKNEVLIGDVISISRGASPRPISAFITDREDGVNWIKIGDVSENSLYIMKTEERITPEGAKKSRMVHKGDFILSNSMSFGRPYILGINGCVHDGWLIMSDFKETFNELYLYHAIRSDDVQYQFSGKVNGATVKNLNSDLVKKTFIKVPPMELQNQFAAFVEQTDKSKLAVQQSLEKLETLKKALMQKYFG